MKTWILYIKSHDADVPDHEDRCFARTKDKAVKIFSNRLKDYVDPNQVEELKKEAKV